MIEYAQLGFGLHDEALALLRFASGAFFMCSGYNKLFNRGRHDRFMQTLKEDKVPALKFNEWWVPGWEFIGGMFLMIGFNTAFVAGVLLVICAVACFAEAKQRVMEYQPINKVDMVADVLYLPEVLYIVMLAVNVVSGSGKYSIDWMLHHG